MVLKTKQDRILAKEKAKLAKIETERAENEIMFNMSRQNPFKFNSNAYNVEYRRRFSEKFAVVVFTVVSIPFIMIAFNCACNKPFIPESQEFCNDAFHLFTKYELRETFRMNYRLTLTNLRAFVIHSITGTFYNKNKPIEDKNIKNNEKVVQSVQTEISNENPTD